MTDAFTPAENLSSFRRIAAAMWKRPSDPSIYGSMDVDVTETLRFIDRFRAETGRRLTMTHVVAHALARVFARHPELNAKIRFGARVELRRTVDLFVSVATDGGKDLSGARIASADQLDLSAMIDAVEKGARGVRRGEDPGYQKSRDTLRAMPWWLTRPALALTDLLTNELHLDLPKHGMPRDPFGTAVVTNVGSFGIDTAFAPFIPAGRTSMLLLLTEVKPRPMVVDGRVEARPVLRLCATFDHRIVDGSAAGVVAKELRELVERPRERGVAPSLSLS
jgi:pyruvate/2-oxoglutarate dehydrogenase complex dihydrolipoamide acyltransferase (E2) component